MTAPCENQLKIDQLVTDSVLSKETSKQMLRNQQSLAEQHLLLVTKLDGFFERLEVILLADMERRTQLAQTMQDVNQLYGDSRELRIRMADMETTKAQYDGANIYTRVPKLWEWYQQEQGWRRLIPTIMTIITGLFAIYISLSSMNDTEEDRKMLEQFLNKGETTQTYGVPK